MYFPCSFPTYQRSVEALWARSYTEKDILRAIVQGFHVVYAFWLATFLCLQCFCVVVYVLFLRFTWTLVSKVVSPTVVPLLVLVRGSMCACVVHRGVLHILFVFITLVRFNGAIALYDYFSTTPYLLLVVESTVVL